MKLLTYHKKEGYGLGAVAGDYIIDLKKDIGACCMLKLLDMGDDGTAEGGPKHPAPPSTPRPPAAVRACGRR